MLVAREAKGEGRYRKNFEVIDIATLATVRQAGDATILGAFQRWRDAEWVRASLSQR
jgi:hypothetical protein